MNPRKLWPHLGRLPRIFLTFLLVFVADTVVGSDVDTLYRAAGDGNTTQVLALLDSGVDVNGRTSDGSYALNRAAVFNEVEVMQLLLERGADPNVQNREGDTPLICATKYAGGHAATVKALVEAGTNLAIKDKDGKTALDYAMAEGQQDAIALLEKPGN